MRLNFTALQFIVQYHALQDQITRLHLEQSITLKPEKKAVEEKNKGEFQCNVWNYSLSSYQENTKKMSKLTKQGT